MIFEFEWDPAKEKLNFRRHGVAFSEAQTVFSDPMSQVFEDTWHSSAEPRELIFGHSSQGRLLGVCYTERAGGLVRIISARCATRTERRRYEEDR